MIDLILAALITQRPAIPHQPQPGDYCAGGDCWDRNGRPTQRGDRTMPRWQPRIDRREFAPPPQNPTPHGPTDGSRRAQPQPQTPPPPHRGDDRREDPQNDF